MACAELQAIGLMFHPGDDPAELNRVDDGKRTFSDAEVSEVRFVIDVLFAQLGKGVNDAAYPIVMSSYRLRFDAGWAML